MLTDAKDNAKLYKRNATRLNIHQRNAHTQWLILENTEKNCSSLLVLFSYRAVSSFFVPW